ncbi:MAG: YitT family protein [Bacillota bacterium]|nr:YitT family protein [Bacillota bacterium]
MEHNHAMVNRIRTFREKISIKDLIGILIGSAILAFGIQTILVPAHLLTGGVTGLALILNFLIGYEIWIFYFALNIPIFVVGFRSISPRFALYSLVGMFALTFFLGVGQDLHISLGINDLLLSSVLGGVLIGIGSGINLRSKGSTGGLDIIAVLVRKYWGHSFGTTFFFINIAILAMFLVSNNIELTLYTAISMFITSKVVDAVEAGPSVTKSATIVSDQSDAIAQEIMHNLHRGCTCMTGKGAYTGEERKILMVTVGKTQLPRLKEIVFVLDPMAFIMIYETIEVYGRGFKPSRDDF